MTLPEKQVLLLAHLMSLKNSQERFAYVVRRGRDCVSFPISSRSDALLIKGCLAKVWFNAELGGGKCYFTADSDSAIVKGIAVILCDFYSGHSPQEVLTLDPSFLEKAGIDQHLTPNRRNSLSKIWEKMRAFATQHLNAAA